MTIYPIFDFVKSNVVSETSPYPFSIPALVLKSGSRRALDGLCTVQGWLQVLGDVYFDLFLQLNFLSPVFVV